MGGYFQREVAKENSNSELHVKLDTVDTNKREKHLYQMAEQRDQAV